MILPSSQPHLDRLPHVAVVPSDSAVEFSPTARSHPSLGQQRVWPTKHAKYTTGSSPQAIIFSEFYRLLAC